VNLAKVKFKQGLSQVGVEGLSLTLKYPTGDRPTEEAMKDLCARLSRDLPGLTLTAEGVNPHELRDQVEGTSNYDLAYCHYDFPEGAFWLLPLLGSGAKSGENFLGYTGPLLSQVQRATNLRYFPRVQELARAIHAKMVTEGEMPFIPLWQLDALYAVRRGRIDAPPFDPREPFARAAEWRSSRS
ncbi:MAG: hypothetical protein ACRC33_27030, partial [Gemmataceae bacterium]